MSEIRDVMHANFYSGLISPYDFIISMKQKFYLYLFNFFYFNFKWSNKITLPYDVYVN